jgi:uncharacterized protein with PQ loop repeat
MPASAVAAKARTREDARAALRALAPYADFFGMAATVWGVVGACSSLLQARRLVRTGSAESVSLAFLSIYLGGFLIWGLYGLAIVSTPLIVVDVVGTLASSVTVVLALRLRYRTRRGPKRSTGRPAGLSA